MSWFDLGAEHLKYASTGNTSVDRAVLQDFAFTTFSSLHWWVYILFVGAALIIGYVVFSNLKRVEFDLGSYWKFAIVLSVVFCIYAAFFVLLLWDEPFGLIAEKMREGTFGDSFGTLNTLFSGLAFSGVLITMLFQRKDLSETRAQIAHQQIESQFYSMLSLQQEVVRNFDLQRGHDGAVVSQGRDCFKNWTAGIIHYYKKAKGTHEERVAQGVEDLLVQHKADLGLYFRSLYSVFRFVYNCEHKERAQFGLVVRSLLSDHELVVLFYNSLGSRGIKFRKYIYEFALFDNLEVELLLDKADVNRFGFQAYGSNRSILEMLEVSPAER